MDALNHPRLLIVTIILSEKSDSEYYLAFTGSRAPKKRTFKLRFALNKLCS